MEHHISIGRFKLIYMDLLEVGICIATNITEGKVLLLFPIRNSLKCKNANFPEK